MSILIEITNFSVMKIRISDSITLKEHLYLISKWTYSWKMSFNPDPSKQATEIIFSTKRSISNDIF